MHKALVQPESSEVSTDHFQGDLLIEGAIRAFTVKNFTHAASP